MHGYTIDCFGWFFQVHMVYNQFILNLSHFYGRNRILLKLSEILMLKSLNDIIHKKQNIRIDILSIFTIMTFYMKCHWFSSNYFCQTRFVWNFLLIQLLSTHIMNGSLHYILVNFKHITNHSTVCLVHSWFYIHIA